MPGNLQKIFVLIASLLGVLGLVFLQEQQLSALQTPIKTVKVATPIESISSTTSFNIKMDKPTKEAPSFAVVELFTSQGCSSCPPADRVLREMIDDAEKTGKAVYGLSFHVDYWNYLGWKDPYSRSEFSDRQRKYNQRLKSRGSYTPQMIVNGTSEFVGSKRGYANQEVSYALEKAAKVAVNISDLEVDKTKNQLELTYQISGECQGCQVHIAAVERNLKDAVRRGENHGRTLQHDNVVRAFDTQDFEATSKVKLDLPRGMDFSESSVVVYVQERGFGGIVGAISQGF